MIIFDKMSMDLFPSKFLYLKVDDKVLMSNIMQEILSKKDEIKTVSTMHERQSTDKYLTDFRSPVVLENFEDLILKIGAAFEEDGLNFNLKNYWTAIYTHAGLHNMHIHKESILDDCNYSGIFYLSDFGQTQFFSPNPTAHNLSHYEHSEAGKIVMFPSSIPHWVDRHENVENDRYVISFNFSLYEVKN